MPNPLFAIPLNMGTGTWIVTIVAWLGFVVMFGLASAGGAGTGGGIVKIEVSSMSECREQGELFKAASFRLKNKYVCLKGK